ncbi:hypothetical protein AVEN_217481-1 [Araneus ventricosus]|uniref:Uncharacterized protein n=1 Tax=Araneus ventricosus TaxID=182803 RepID=A0A4Y2TWZ1_ARAVE|nr:hypothetical protein AVEN_217481-1 [Araneus ventricosus]
MHQGTPLGHGPRYTTWPFHGKWLTTKLRGVSEKKSANAQDKGEFSNYKAGILMLYVEAISSLVPEKNLESEQTSSMVDLLIELKNEFAAFRKHIYSKVDSFSKLICSTDDTIQKEEPRPSLQQEIIETELKSETSTYASVAQTSSAIPEGPGTAVNDIINLLAPLNLKFLQCHRLKIKYQSYASFHIEVCDNDPQQLLDSTFWPEGCLIAELYGKLKNDQISHEVIPRSDSIHPSLLDLPTNTDSKRLSLIYQNFRDLRTKTVEFYRSVASVEYDVICVTETWLCEDMDS